MTPNPALTITLGDHAGDGEARWIRLEQVEMRDEGATMEQAAALVDAIYGIEPCDGMGTGGEEADEENLLEQSEFLEKARELLELGACEESGVWDAEVDVYRSHQTDGYSLQGERIEAGETTPMSRAVTETVELDGASYDLQWPYGGDISVSGGAIVRDVRGSTVNFAVPVMGLTRISYTAVWDRVKVRVRPAALGHGDPLAGLHYVAGTPKKTERDDAAYVVAFWRDLAAECSLSRPPVDDQGLEQTEIQRLCNRETHWQVVGDCWKTIETFNLCNCSGEESPDEPEREDVDAPCPEGVHPDTWLGLERRQGEYVDCPGDDREGLNDPAFFREHCCEKRPYSPLPRCRVTREEYKGGAEIEHGPEYWKIAYGERVRLTPIMPRSGRCGEIVKRWEVPGVIEGPPVLPERLTVDRGERFSVTVISGGRPPFTWVPPRGVVHLGDAGMGFIGMFRAGDDFRGGDLIAMDSCGREATCRLNACVGWQPWRWMPGREMLVNPGELRGESFFWDRDSLPDDFLESTGIRKEYFPESGKCYPNTGSSADCFYIISNSLKYVLTCYVYTCATTNKACNEAIDARYSEYNDVVPAEMAKDCLHWIVRRYWCSMTGSWWPVQFAVSGDRVRTQCYPSGDVSRPADLYWYIGLSGWAYICD